MNLASLTTLCLCLCVPSHAKSTKKVTVVPLHPPRVSTEPITFIWPPEGFTLSADNEFILGNVVSATVPFSINGQTVTVHKDGGFLAWLPITAGTFTFRAELKLSSETIISSSRTIFVPLPPTPLPDDPLTIDRSSLFPKSELVLRSGDWWTGRMKASRGQSARLRIGNGPWRDMRESVVKPGTYELIQQIAPGEHFEAAPIEYQLGSGWNALHEKSDARISAVISAPEIATVKTKANGFVNIKNEPNQGLLIFPPPGTRMIATGREGDSIRVDLSSTLSGWIESKDVELSTMSAPPHAETGDVGVTETPLGATVSIGLTDRVPFEIVPSDSLDSLVVRIFYAVGHTNNVTHVGGDDFVDLVRWRQESNGVVVYTIGLKPGRKIWGWHGRFDGTKLRVDVRRPLKSNRKRPLEGWKIMLDPGHMPSAPGATGPLATKEMDANLAIAQVTAELLRKEGALPILTRSSSTDEVSLTDRPKLALEQGADLFISIHNNALPDGSNPFSKARGFSVYYYHPQSLALARAIHDSYIKNIPLADDGLLWGNLLVARLSAVPSILIENAYLLYPEQEALLNDPSFRTKLGRSIVSGLRAFALDAGNRSR